MSFDAAEYRKRVLIPYKGAKLSELQGALRELKTDPSLSVPSKLDLVGLYDISPGMDDTAVAARVAEVKNVFSLANATIKAISPNLQELHGFLSSRNPTFAQASFWRGQLADRVERSKAELSDFAQDVSHELQIFKVVTRPKLRDLARGARLPDSISDQDLAAAVTSAGLTVVPEIVLPSTPVPSSVMSDLTKTTCMSLVDAIFANRRPTSFSVIDGFRADNGVSLTIATVEEARRNTDLHQSNENDWIKKALGGVLSAARTDAQLHSLLLAHFIDLGKRAAQASTLRVLALKSLTDTGLDQLDAARILVQFADDSKAAGFPDVHDKLATGEMREARRLFDALVSLSGGSQSDPMEKARVALVGAEKRLEDLRAVAKAAVERSDIDAAAKALNEARTLCTDDESLDAAVRALPPAAPLNLVLSTGQNGRNVAITWAHGFGASEDISYRVIRKLGVAPRNALDGDLVAERAGSTHCVDTAPPLATNVFYAVAATRGGGFSPVTTDSIVVLPPVSDVAVTTDLTSVNLRWSTPSEAKAVIVTQTAPDGSTTTVAINAHSGATVAGLVTGASYTYLITAAYRSHAGAELRSATVRVEAVTRGDARPVASLSIRQYSGTSRTAEVEANWQEVPGFSIEIWTFTQRPPWHYGTRVPMSQLASHGQRLTGATAGDRGRQGVRGAVQPGLRHYLAITRDGDEGVVGQRQELGICPPLVGVRGERFGDVVVLSCEWPGEDFDVKVRWSGRGGSGETVVSLVKYQQLGGFRIPVGRGGSHFVLTTQPANSTAPWTSPPAIVDIPAAPTAVTYHVAWRRRLWQAPQATLTFAAESPVDPVQIAIVAKPGTVMPFNVTDGIPLKSCTLDFRDGAENTVTVELKNIGKHYWVRAFATISDHVRIVDPPSRDLQGA